VFIHELEEVHGGLVHESIFKLGLLDFEEYSAGFKPLTIDIVFETLVEHFKKHRLFSSESDDSVSKIFITLKQRTNLTGLWLLLTRGLWPNRAHELLLKLRPLNPLLHSLHLLLLVALIDALWLSVYFGDNLQIRTVKIAGKQFDWLAAALHGDAVDLAHILLGFLG